MIGVFCIFQVIVTEWHLCLLVFQFLLLLFLLLVILVLFGIEIIEMLVFNVHCEPVLFWLRPLRLCSPSSRSGHKAACTTRISIALS